MNILSFLTIGLVKPKIDPFKDEYRREIPEAKVYVNGNMVHFSKPKKKYTPEYRPDYTYSS